ncbi:MAG: FtsH protease activity modulator HflK [Rickettsiales bacterium]
MAWGDKDNNNGPWGKPTIVGGNGGGKGSGGGGPKEPDFEEILKKLRNKWKSLFPDDGSNNKKGFSLIFVIFLLLWLSSGIYFVKTDEQGVVLRFGEYNRTTGAGLNYHMPYPIETALTPRVTTINRVGVGFHSGNNYWNGKMDTSKPSIPEESLMLTGDENIVDINFEVQWKIDKAPDFLFNVRNPEETVKAVSESAMREVIGKIKIATVLAEGKSEVELDTKKLIQEMLDSYNAGINIVKVNLLKADPPAQVIDAFRDVQTARADLETSRNQAQAYRNDILPKARGEAQRMILEAEGYKQEVIAKAEGEASRFLAVYNEFRQARDVTKKRIYLETMEEILDGMNKIVMESKSSNGVLPYLPLSQLDPAKK